MMVLKLCLVAEGVSVDRQTNELSIYNVLEGIEASGFPLFVQRISFLTVYERDVATDPEVVNGQMQVTLGDNAVMTQAVTINFQGKKRSRIILRFGGLLVPAPGDLRFRFIIPNGPPAEYKIEVEAPALQPQVAA